MGETIMALENLQRELDHIVSKGNTELRAAADAFGNSGKIVVFPANEEEVVRVTKFAHEHKLTVIPEGRGSKSGYGGSLEQADILLSMRRMAGVVEYSVGDLTLTALPGTPMSELEAVLTENGQMFPLFPARPEDSTLGGAVAANISGPKRIRYGSARDWIIGLRVVYPDGTIIRTGGKVVKNVAGYDMTKMMIGSMGTLGVITEITIKLRPKPSDEKLLPIYSGTIEPLYQLAEQIQNSYMEPVTLELLNPTLSEQLTGKREYALMVGFEDTDSSVDYQLEWLNRQLSSVPQLQAGSVAAGEQIARWWQSFRMLAPVKGEGTVALKLGCWMTDAPALMGTAEQAANRSGLSLHMHGGMGTGIIHAYVDPESGTEEDIVQWVSEVRRAAEGMKGYAIVEHASLVWRSKLGVWGAKPSSFRLIEGIKNKIDPTGILNPGRYIGGL
jgi:glycolate oxidase FAD binding subunit